MSAYFIFNNIKSEDMGIVLKELPPITKANKKVEVISVSGRNGSLYIDEECYEPIRISIPCFLKKGIDPRKITSWLNQFGTITFSDELDKFYNAAIINSIPLQRVFRLYRDFIIQLELQPFALSKKEYIFNYDKRLAENILDIDSTATMQPYIKMVGKGIINLTINNKTCVLNIDDGYIELDSESQNAYKGIINKNNKMNGEFPILVPGSNRIEIVGDATMEMKYRKAYI